MYKFRNNFCILVGDTHSTETTYELLNIRIPDGSDVVHIGDGGWGFGKPEYALDNARSWQDRIDKLCAKLNIKLFHIIGNHDNPAVWEFPSTDNLIFVKSGEVGEFPNGKKVLFVGGGVSVDRFKRKKGESYWIMETTPYINPVEKTDFVFSHDCPDNFNHPTATLPSCYGWYVERDVTLMDDSQEQRENMARIWRESGAKKMAYGHFHRSIIEEIDGVWAKCLDINELYEFNAEQ
jgi:predicted phosphodiesterase